MSLLEIVPFVKEMVNQKPSRGMVKVYAVGTVLAFFGVVIGLVETICRPFSPREPTDEELERSISGEHRPLSLKEIEIERTDTTAATEVVAVSKKQASAVQRNTANRLHAS